MFKKVVIALILLLPALVLYASKKPDDLHVERSISINATAEQIFPLINEFYQWEKWTPYNKDPAMKKLFSGSPKGVGATYTWKGNKDVGEGEITITDSTPPNKIVLDLHMIQPFEAHNAVVFTLSTDGKMTKVTWAMDCKQNLVSKVMDVFYSMDSMIGNDFAAGLAKLKLATET
ncbi:Polyketide cyclase [Ferriphaselus amnicola]|uniref:Polyketide cyclase n=1 Tax=Ferriphaselus amnicola TaxID=1188319 RepID=A0A2Z6GAJ0_9PROT|nr:SRPBCC family protein [Ferriphaselus amnicola]BBE50379.1 Polyketide cyclase [Ferriphaselus amnicola]